MRIPNSTSRRPRISMTAWTDKQQRLIYVLKLKNKIKPMDHFCLSMIKVQGYNQNLVILLMHMLISTVGSERHWRTQYFKYVRPKNVLTKTQLLNLTQTFYPEIKKTEWGVVNVMQTKRRETYTHITKA